MQIDIADLIALACSTKHDYSAELLLQADCPILLILGDRDQFIPLEHIITLYHALPNAELAILPNGDHQVDRKYPDVFCRVIADYFRRQIA